MAERTLGWVQDSCKIDNLKRVVQLFLPGSKINRELADDKIPRLVSKENNRDKMISYLNQEKIVIPYRFLKGRGVPKGCTRENSPCSGIIQAVLPGQTKEYQSDWPADNFLRWAIAVGFVEFDRKQDACFLSKLGLEYAKSEDESDKEKEALTIGLLSSPPVCRVLTLLAKNEGAPLTKFELGQQLGFVGEAGFTSYSQDIVIEAINANPDMKNNLLSDTEGSSDKYARTICSWLKQMGWVIQEPKTVAINCCKQQISQTFNQAWKITVEGKRALNRSCGKTKYKKISKLVSWEMLATKTKDKKYLRNKRALILQDLTKKRTIEQLLTKLKDKGFVEENADSVLDDINGLRCIGINISEEHTAYKLEDTIVGLKIPKIIPSETKINDKIIAIKNNVRPQLKKIDHKYLALIDLSFDGNANREFEFLTAEFFVKELKFQGERLGEGRRPDVIVYHNTDGLIIDNKAYSKGFSIPIRQADEMVRYLVENQKRDSGINTTCWWKTFSDDVTTFYFLFITGCFTGQWEAQIESIIQRTNVCGSGITSEDLLLCGEQYKAKAITSQEFIERMLFISREK